MGSSRVCVRVYYISVVRLLRFSGKDKYVITPSSGVSWEAVLTLLPEGNGNFVFSFVVARRIKVTSIVIVYAVKSREVIFEAPIWIKRSKFLRDARRRGFSDIY